ncbi:hypothetical protein EN792_033760 [Mesorhizobium sp. M00.F.Ca.ET.149.01.1.1]|nr:hypothetical protein EN840_33150 [Mesorhizobium sp. M8A.F.Ca.ET.197.01.1.1]TGR36589.1 hypothetical protein EN842_53970 [bacterium M00.F.Ca.ET.199.01.1.1]TGR40136.1 hypothetical protein EN841_33145 [Mesorhizobium sp. M8A.F.Ca.ET.198.01.1.1]TGV81625.1 hypothetical protein EN792_033760 [Mesorhizobium sp. M00.F.Ca.ET.149.01.1.1]
MLMTGRVWKLIAHGPRHREARPQHQPCQGLQGRAYYDPSFYEAERKHVFAAGWVGVGFASDIPNPGDVVPISVAGYELILVRLKDGSIKCYHNICRHRSMKLVKDKGNVRTIRCSYYCWTCGLGWPRPPSPASTRTTRRISTSPSCP